MLFYQADHLATEISNQGIRHIVRSQDTALAQLDQGTAAQPLHVDQANSVLNGMPDKTIYSAYGFFKEGQSTAVLAFNGERLDPSTRTYALGNGNRTYHPTLSRFSSPDLFSPFDQGGLNAYAYCENDPINKMDPSGNVPRFIRSFFKGAANRLHLRTPGSKNSQVILEAFNPQPSSPTRAHKRPLPDRPAGQRLSEGSRFENNERRSSFKMALSWFEFSQALDNRKRLSTLQQQRAHAYSAYKRRRDMRLSTEAEGKRYLQLRKEVKQMESEIEKFNRTIQLIRLRS
ncbi:RHS repeat-associated core domain-containing protein [Pseudomonas entomophila]|uniref:RHS repeat-associated core domain-containing protein n=1 Tax=Pseudomonas entomophila TaxID=312306 RepID=UPI003EBC0479